MADTWDKSEALGKRSIWRARLRPHSSVCSLFLQRDSWHQTQPGPSVPAEASLFIFWLRSLFSDFPLITSAAEGKHTCSQCSVAGLVPVERTGVLTGAFVVVLWGQRHIYKYIYLKRFSVGVGKDQFKKIPRGRGPKCLASWFLAKLVCRVGAQQFVVSPLAVPAWNTIIQRDILHSNAAKVNRLLSLDDGEKPREFHLDRTLGRRHGGRAQVETGGVLQLLWSALHSAGPWNVKYSPQQIRYITDTLSHNKIHGSRRWGRRQVNPIQSPQRKTSDLHAERERAAPGRIFFFLSQSGSERFAPIVSLAEILLYIY